MKMVRAFIRPEKEQEVVQALEGAGYGSLTKMPVFGRGKQKGLQVGPIYYDELPKTLLMLVVEDENAKHAVEVIEDKARKRPNHVAFQFRDDPLTLGDLDDRINRVANGLLAVGVKPGDKVAIIGDNRPEWVFAEIAAQAAGAASVGIYQDSNLTEVAYVIDHCDASVVIAEDQEQVDKILEMLDKLPKVRHVIYTDPRGLRKYEHPALVSRCFRRRRATWPGRGSTGTRCRRTRTWGCGGRCISRLAAMSSCATRTSCRGSNLDSPARH